MTKSFDIQLYIYQSLDEQDLVNSLSKLLGISVSTLDFPNKYAPAFMMIINYEKGFRMGVNVSWSASIRSQADNVQIAKILSQQFATIVATNLPDEHPLSKNPLQWCVAQPDGSLFRMSEDTSESTSDGLILNNEILEELLASPIGDFQNTVYRDIDDLNAGKENP